MKKLLLFALVPIFGIVNKSTAQNVEFGVKGGLNISGLHYTLDNSLNSRVSIYLGALAHIHINKTWAVQPELTYSLQGATQVIDGNDVTWRLNYVNIPILLQYMFENGFRLQTGPQLGLLASAKLKEGGTITDVKNNYATADFSWSFGAGYLTSSGLGIDARYNLGVNNINNNSFNNSNNNSGMLYNRVFQIGLFYQFKNL